nr:hypothetical protein [Tanacetum cinerariifolium]
FTWVFFLATKDKTSRIFKSFITEIENLVDKKVKIIRCDNGTEFKNRVMNEFYEEKGIKREYRVARTPQQNEIAEGRNKTLIENRVLVVKPHFKTPYELFRGRTPALSFMRPFGCHVTILNTLDHLGKFDEKSDEGFLVGYSTNSKAFRVYNTRTRKVEENLHIKFLENKPLITCTNSNDFAGKGASFDASQSSMEARPSQDYILMPLWNNGSLFDSSLKDSDGDNHDNDGFLVYQMDVKRAFLYEMIKEKVYVCQPPGFEVPYYPDKVFKGKKALYGLHQAPRAWYETMAKYLLDNGFHRGNIDQTLFTRRQKEDILLVQVYVDDIIFRFTKKELCTKFELLMLDKFQMSLIGELTFFLGLHYDDVKPTNTPMEKEKALLKDSDGDDVNVHLYMFMIRSLMYLTSSRPDIMFDVCFWYPKDSLFDLVAYTNSDYAGASLDRKYTSRGCQFLGYRLISWQCKKQTVVATFTIEAEYVAAASCCGQVLWIQNQLLDYGISTVSY